MNLGLDGKHFVVCGGSRGIGRAVADLLVAEGARVLLVGRGEGGLRKAARELGGPASFCVADLSDPTGADAIAETAMREEALDGALINGPAPSHGSALELDDEEWHRAFGAFLGGPVRLLRALTPEMRDGASLLFVTSSSARQTVAGNDASNVLRPGVRRSGQKLRARPGAEGARQQPRPRAHRDGPLAGSRRSEGGDAGNLVGRSSAGSREEDTARTLRQIRGGGPCGCLPALASGLLRHRRLLAGGRRPSQRSALIRPLQRATQLR